MLKVKDEEKNEITRKTHAPGPWDRIADVILNSNESNDQLAASSNPTTCPACGSIDIGSSWITSHTYKCKNCGHRFN